MELDEALDEFRHELESIEPIYKKGKVRQLLDRVLSRPEMAQTKKKFKKPRAPPNARQLHVETNTKENEIFGNVMPDPFGFASQDTNATDDKQRPVAIKGAKTEKVFSLTNNKKKGKQLKIRKTDRVRSRREILAETQTSTDSVKSHPLPKKQLAPASQEILSQNNVTPGEPQTPPRARRARAAMRAQRRKSPADEQVHHLTECKQSTRIEQKQAADKDDLVTVVTSDMAACKQSTRLKDKNEPIEEEDAPTDSQQVLERMLKNRLSNRKPVELTIPRKKTRSARPKSPTQEDSTQSTVTMAPPQMKTPKMRQHLAEKSSTPSRSILKQKETPTTEKRTPSRISFGPDEIKKYVKSSSTPDETQASLEGHLASEHSTIDSVVSKQVPTQADPTIYSVNDTYDDKTQKTETPPPPPSAPIFDDEIYTNEETAPPPETYAKVATTQQSESSGERIVVPKKKHQVPKAESKAKPTLKRKLSDDDRAEEEPPSKWRNRDARIDLMLDKYESVQELLKEQCEHNKLLTEQNAKLLADNQKHEERDLVRGAEMVQMREMIKEMCDELKNVSRHVTRLSSVPNSDERSAVRPTSQIEHVATPPKSPPVEINDDSQPKTPTKSPSVIKSTSKVRRSLNRISSDSDSEVEVTTVRKRKKLNRFKPADTNRQTADMMIVSDDNDETKLESDHEMDAVFNSPTQDANAVDDSPGRRSVKTLDILKTQKTAPPPTAPTTAPGSELDSQASAGLFDESLDDDYSTPLASPPDQQHNNGDVTVVPNMAACKQSTKLEDKNEPIVIDDTARISEEDDDDKDDLDDSRLVQNAMKNVAQSTPARSTLANNKKRVTKMAPIDERPPVPTDWHSIPGCINKHIEKSGGSSAVAAKWEKYNVVFAGTQLNTSEKEMARKLALKLGGTFHQQVIKYTTHLITPADVSKNMRTAQKTLKYIQAMSLGCWVVSTGWMEMSLSIGRKADEKMYEITGDTENETSNGPRKSREERQQTNQDKRMFANCAVVLQGNFSQHTPVPVLQTLLVNAVFDKVESLVNARDMGTRFTKNYVISESRNTNDFSSWLHSQDRDWLLDRLSSWSWDDAKK